MQDISRSYLSVHYGLRPAKQVERRILLDALQLLWGSGFDIRSYKYIGMGSIHFVDFAMFHRYLGIEDMLSVEISSEIDRRVSFNAPYQELITTEVGSPIGNFLSSFEPNRKYLVWLDYDNVLSSGMLQDVALACTTLTAGSIILLTVDTEPPVRGPCREEDTEENLSISYKYFHEIAGHLMYPFPEKDFFRHELLPRINTKILFAQIATVFRNRTEHFQPLFNFLYADGHRMLTIGGMVVTRNERRRLKSSRLLSQNYVRTNTEDEPFVIRVPVLTRLEQLYLDSHMPCQNDWKPSKFELEEKEVQEYRKIYRFYPSYAEVVF